MINEDDISLAWEIIHCDGYCGDAMYTMGDVCPEVCPLLRHKLCLGSNNWDHTECLKNAKELIELSKLYDKINNFLDD
jgi:hypothetical protein